jgi:hypothetical protein
MDNNVVKLPYLETPSDQPLLNRSGVGADADLSKGLDAALLAQAESSKAASALPGAEVGADRAEWRQEAIAYILYLRGQKWITTGQSALSGLLVGTGAQLGFHLLFGGGRKT